MNDAEAIARWLLTFAVIMFALLPVVAWIGRPLGSAKFGLAPPVGLVVLTWVVWWPASLVGIPFNRWTLVAALVIVGGVGWAVWIRNGYPARELRPLLIFEAVWLVAFSGYALFRSYQPDIINTEKPMEIALLSSISRSSEVPAPDPWFAGESINYYYFGYQSVASIIKLSGVPASIGFNLALASIFASCAVVAAAIGSRIAGSLTPSRGWTVAGSIIPIVLLLFAGNLETARRLIDEPRSTIDAGWWDGIGWQASRVIYDHGVHAPGDERQTINEFPAFSFVLGDLHPHVLTYPLLGAVVALAVGLFLDRNGPSRPRLLAVGGLIGILYASNSWDAPAGFLVVAGAVALTSGRAWRDIGLDIATVVVGAIAAALPFILTFDAPLGVGGSGIPDWLIAIPGVERLAMTFGVVTWRPSSLRELLLVHGAWLAIFALFVAIAIFHDRQYLRLPYRHRHALLAIGLIAVGMAIAWSPAIVVLGVPFAAALWISIVGTNAPVRLVAALFAAGFLLAIVPEYVYIQDVFGDRMNTVFKLYFQSWLLLSIATASAAIVCLRMGSNRQLWPAALVTVVVSAATLPYAPLSAQDWTNDFSDRRGLDGAEYLQRTAPEDAAAIEWIASRANSSDSIVEQPGCSYQNAFGAPMNRVSAFAGVPALIGWVGHESQWRRGQWESVDAVLNERVEAARDYLSGDFVETSPEPRFVVLGRQELTASSSCGLTEDRSSTTLDALLGAGWQVVFEEGDVRILVRSNDPLALANR